MSEYYSFAVEKIEEEKVLEGLDRPYQRLRNFTSFKLDLRDLVYILPTLH